MKCIKFLDVFIKYLKGKIEKIILFLKVFFLKDSKLSMNIKRQNKNYNQFILKFYSYLNKAPNFVFHFLKI